MKQVCGCDILSMVSTGDLATSDSWYESAMEAADILTCPELVDWIRVCYGVLAHRLNDQNDSSLEGFVHLMKEIHSEFGKSIVQPLDK